MRYAIAPTACCKGVGNGAVLVDLDRNVHYSLNAMGWQVWGGLRDGLTPLEISQKLAKHYRMPLLTIESDVLSFLAKLEGRGIIYRADNPSSS